MKAWMTRKELEIETGYSRVQISTLRKEMQEEIGKRYDRYVFAGERMTNYFAFLDYLTYRRQLKDKNMRKFVPAFDPEKLAKLAGGVKVELAQTE